MTALADIKASGRAGVALSPKMVIVLGLPRSGTTLLGRSLAGLPGAAYLEEPNVIWRYRNFARLGHDAFGAEDATPAIAAFIRKRLLPAVGPDAPQLVFEKTPANVLRPDFVAKVFPEAHFVVLRRDRASIERSMHRIIAEGIDGNKAGLNDDRPFRKARIQASRFLAAPIGDMPAYLPMALSGLTGGRLFSDQTFWGPRPPGWQGRMAMPLAERISWQCAEMEQRLEAFLTNAPSRTTYLDYDRLAEDPQAVANLVRQEALS